MKRKLSLLALPLVGCFLFSQYCLALSNQSKPANAIERWSETVDTRELAIEYAGIAKSDPSAVIDRASGHFSYVWRHGSFARNDVQTFEYIAGDGTSTANMHSLIEGEEDKAKSKVLHWNIDSGGLQGDGAILIFTANVECNFIGNAIEIGGNSTNAYTNYYLKEKDATAFTQIQSNKHVADHYAENIALAKTHLNEGDSIAWEFIYTYTTETDWKRYIRNVFPSFTFEENVIIETETLNGEDLVNSLADTSDYVTSPKELVKYSVRAGSILDDNYTTLPLGDLGDTSKNYCLSLDGLVIKSGQKYTFELIALEDILVNMSFDNFIDSSIKDLTITGYKKFSAKNKAKVIYEDILDTTFDGEFTNGELLLDNGDALYIEFAASESGEHFFKSLLNLVVSQPIDGESYLDFPKYHTHDYSEVSSIDYKDAFLETAINKSEVVETRDFDIQLLTGTLSAMGKYDFYHADDGKYVIGDDEEPNYGVYATKDMYGVNDGAALEEDRIAFGKSKNVIFVITAKVDTHIDVTHPATTTGWINGGTNYVGAYQRVRNHDYTISEVNIPQNNPVQDENTFAASFDLKAGDVGIYLFGSVYSLQVKYNITPSFTSNPDAYDKDARNNLVLNYEQNSYILQDFVSDTVVSHNGPNEYGVLNVLLGHGSVENIEEFNTFEGNGHSEKDCVKNGLESQKLACFWRFQMRCGTDDDAIVKMTATRNTHFVLSWSREGGITSSFFHTALRYYCLDTDGLSIMLKTKFITNDYEEGAYNLEVDLLAGQSIVIDFTSFGGSYGVIFYNFHIDALTADYNEEGLIDFTEARRLFNYKNEKIHALEDYVSTLDETLYSITNWSYIEDYLGSFISNVKDLDSIGKVDVLYEQTLAKIKAVRTLAQEKTDLANAKVKAKEEARSYIDSYADQLSKANKEKAETLYEEFVKKVDTLKTEKNVQLELTKFKVSIAKLVEEGPDKVNVVLIVIICCSSAALVAAGVVTFIVIKKKKSKK